MRQYLLIFREDPDAFADLSPGEIQAIIQKYVEWTRRLEETKSFVRGQKLTRTGRMLRRQGDEVSVTNGPYIEANELLGGYILIRAESYEHAVELARTGPALERGAIEIREIEASDP